MILGTNWKMHKNYGEAKEYAQALQQSFSNKTLSSTVFIIPSYTEVSIVQDILKDTQVLLGVQNMYWEQQGAYTGEISPRQVTAIGASIVEIGHAERRRLFGETDEMVARKVKAAVDNGLIPLICVGEPDFIFDMNRSEHYVNAQIAFALSLIDTTVAIPIWFAYEPIWAIGTGKSAADDTHIKKIVTAMREEIFHIVGDSAYNAVNILYGGSVSLTKAKDYASITGLNGLFVGRSVLAVENFITLINMFE